MRWKKNKIFRVTTVPLSLKTLLKGQCRYMTKNGFEVVGISSSGPELGEVINYEEIRGIELNMTRKISPIQDIISLIKFTRLCFLERPIIVHSHTPKAGIIAMVGSKIAGIPIRLHTVAGLPLMETHGLKRKLLEYVEKLTYACSTKVYPNSFLLKDFIIASKLTSKNKLQVIGNGSSNGIDTEHYKRSPELFAKADDIRSAYNLSHDDFVFVFVGRLVKDKGIEELVSAFNKISSNNTKVKLLLVGPEERELDPLSDECLRVMQTNKSIITTGFQNDVKPYLAASNALAFPSYREGFPNVPMQAGCFDLPAIVTDINGCNEIITDGENGLIVPVKDSGALQAAMEKLYLDKVLYVKMASNARNMIVSKYEQKKVWSLILTEYRQHLIDKGLV